ncbi:MAG: DEAD/DEAH box helicase [Candidatus Methylarchaceae archaeon HK02M1]|nr:DEAD/DEAH box helicase [Candidatus Methylarchaceae archaeon HK02M1]
MEINELLIPKKLANFIESLGYSTLYPPQEEAVKSGVLDGRSLLLTTPTASGKTLVAMLAAGKTVLEGVGKVVYLTPLRALANEKYNEFKAFERLVKPNGKNVKVMIATGDYDSSGRYLGRGDILVLTNEKFDSVIRHGVPWINSVKLFVADEVHIVGDDHRGPTLEMTMAKILSHAHESQILALSATVKNSKDLAKWLSAELIDTRWRPIKLVEGAYEYGEIKFSDDSVKKIKPTNRGHVIDVAIDSVAEGGQSLIFAETRKRAVSFSLKASEITPHYLTEDEAKEAEKVSREIISAGNETKLSKILSKVVKNGAAFHHAGLTSKHRSIIEDSFKRGLIKVLAATPTLASGVNLPARRVVISSLMRYNSRYGGKTPILVLEYKQMCGRAGRPKYDDVGETVIIASDRMDVEEIFYEYIEGEPEPIRSRLYNESALRTHLLATIASFPRITDGEISNILSKSLLAIQHRRTRIQSKVNRAMKYLIDEDLVGERGKSYVATEFGRRVSILYIDPVTGVIFRDALNIADRYKHHLLGFLHLIISSPDFVPKFPLRNKDLDEALILIDEYRDEFIFPVPNHEFDIYGEFFENFRCLLVLYGWINEWGEDKLLERLGVEPGDLHRAVETAEWLTHALFELAKLLGRKDLLPEIGILMQRIKGGVKSELIPLTKLEGIGRVRARSLYNYGFTDLEKLILAPVDKIASVPKIGTITARGIKRQLLRYSKDNENRFKLRY